MTYVSVFLKILVIAVLGGACAAAAILAFDLPTAAVVGGLGGAVGAISGALLVKARRNTAPA